MRFWERKQVSNQSLYGGVKRKVWTDYCAAKAPLNDLPVVTAWPAGGGGPEPYLHFSRNNVTTSPRNGNHDSLELDAIVAQAAGEPDYKKRIKLSQEAVKIYYDHVASIPIANINKLFAVSDKIGTWDHQAFGFNGHPNMDTLRP